MDSDSYFLNALVKNFINKFGKSFEIVPLRIEASFPGVSDAIKAKMLDVVAKNIIQKIKNGLYRDNISFGNKVISDIIIEQFEKAGLIDLLDTEYLTIKEGKEKEFMMRCENRKKIPLFVAGFYYNIKNKNIKINNREVI